MPLKFIEIEVPAICDICTCEFKVKISLEQGIMGAHRFPESSVAYHTRTKKNGDDVYHHYVCSQCRFSLRDAIESEVERLKQEFIKKKNLELNYEVTETSI